MQCSASDWECSLAIFHFSFRLFWIRLHEIAWTEMYSAFSTQGSKAWTACVQKEDLCTEKLVKGLLRNTRVNVANSPISPSKNYAPHHHHRDALPKKKQVRPASSGPNQVYVTPGNVLCSSLEEYREAEVIENMTCSELRAGTCLKLVQKMLGNAMVWDFPWLLCKPWASFNSFVHRSCCIYLCATTSHDDKRGKKTSS